MDVRRLPAYSYLPVVLAALLGAVAFALLCSGLWLAAIALAGSVAVVIVWLWPEAQLGQTVDVKP